MYHQIVHPLPKFPLKMCLPVWHNNPPQGACATKLSTRPKSFPLTCVPQFAMGFSILLKYEIIIINSLPVLCVSATSHMGRTMYYSLDGPINTISINRDASSVVVAGRNGKTSSHQFIFRTMPLLWSLNSFHFLLLCRMALTL
jgi:hypothetical protein